MESQCCHKKCFGHNFAALIGRIFIGILFLMSGLNKIFNWQESVGALSNLGVQLPALLILIAIIFEVFGSLAVIFGYKTRFGAFLLILFLVPATFLFHSFWALPSGEAAEQIRNFTSNVSLLGGLLLLTAFGPGKYSFDACSCHHHVCATKEHSCCHEDNACK